MSKFILIRKTDITSAVSSVTIDNVFTSRYKNYKVVFENLTSSATGTSDIRLLDSSGTEITANYMYGRRKLNSLNSGSNLHSTSDAELEDCLVDTFNGYGGMSGILNVNQPFESVFTQVTATSYAGDTTSYMHNFGGQLSATTSCRGFKYINSSTLDATGSIYVFGFVES